MSKKTTKWLANGFSKDEMEILHYLVHGYDTSQIATETDRSRSSVYDILEKRRLRYDMNTNEELVAFVVSHRVVEYTCDRLDCGLCHRSS